jgi:putative sterol carrier protein
MLRETARSLPLHKLEGDLRQALRGGPGIPPMAMAAELPAAPPASESRMLPAKRGFLRGRLARLRRLRRRQGGTAEAAIAAGPPPADQMEAVLQRFLADAVADPALLAFSRDRAMTIHFVLKDLRQAFYTRFEGGRVEAGLGAPDGPAQLRLEADAEVLDGVLSGRINAVRAAMTGKLSFSGEARQAMGMQQIQGNLSRLYVAARRAVLER